MRKWMRAGAALGLALLALPGCSGNAGNTAGGTGGVGSVGGKAAGESGTVGNTADDAKITKAVQDKIDADATLKAAGIKAESKGAQVELTGTVKTIADKDKAESLTNEAIKPFSSVNAGVLNNIVIAE